MTDENDKEFAEYLDGRSPVSRRYAALDDEMPPAELDAKILAAATDAMNETPAKVTPLPVLRPPRFKTFAWAAIVLLSFSLVLNIVFEESVIDSLVDPVAEQEMLAGKTEAPATLPGPRQKRDRSVSGRQFDSPVSVPPELRLKMRSNEEAMMAALADAPEGKEQVRAIARAPQPELMVELDESRPRAAGTPGPPPSRLDPGRIDGAMEIVLAHLAMDSLTPAARTVISAPDPDLVAEEVDAGSADTEQPAGLADQGVDQRADSKFLARSTSAAASPDSILRGIATHHDAGRSDDAARELDGFRIRYPDHPVSIRLSEHGY